MDCFTQDLHLMKTDILPIVQDLWCDGFANIANNMKAIAHCGWGPYNYILLLNPELRATMTEEMIQWVKDCGLFPSSVLEMMKHCCYVKNENGDIVLRSIKTVDSNHNTLNFEGGALAQHVSNTIISEVDCQNACEQVQKRKLEGNTLCARIMKIHKKMTAGRLVLDGQSHHLDRNVLDHVNRKRCELENNIIEKQRRADFEYLKHCYAADKVIERYGDVGVEKQKRRDEIVAYLKSLKGSKDSAMPSSRKAIEKRFYEWKDQSHRVLEQDIVVSDRFNQWVIEQEGADSI